MLKNIERESNMQEIQFYKYRDTYRILRNNEWVKVDLKTWYLSILSNEIYRIGKSIAERINGTN